MHSPTAPRFQWRALTGVLMTLGFALLALSGAMLFLALTAGHGYFNRGPLMTYLKNRATRSLGYRAEWAVAAVLCAAVFAGTRAGVPPFSSPLAWNEAFKESWERPAERAPIPHAELLTLAALAQKGGIDLPAATARLTAKGVAGFTAETVGRDLAARTDLSAQQIHEIIMPAPPAAGGPGDGKAGGGLGWKTLAQFCADEGLDLAAARARLSANGLQFEATQPESCS